LRLFPLFLLALAALGQDSQPHLLLTPKRLHRLKLDVERKTDRWINFEKRVKTVPDSPERGFELALYSAVAGNPGACKDAIAWGLAHAGEYRQKALIADWCAAGLSDPDRQNLLAYPAGAVPGNPFDSARDRMFIQIAQGNASRDSAREQWAKLLPSIQQDPRTCFPGLYALFEFLDVVDKNFRLDLRQDDAHLFENLPYIFLMSLHPSELEQPDWKIRASGLMMVNLDANLQASSFVQGWALEDPKMAREGTGVAYEFLWANPYLPGLGYYSMDLWTYDAPSGLLIARKSWEPKSCWVTIFHGNVTTLQCAPHLLENVTDFGKMTLRPMKQKCMEITAEGNRTQILSGLKPGSSVVWEEDGKRISSAVDQSGLYLVSSTASGKVCQK
jgi:hypothetical protein